jgi:hypothetical protein
MPVFLSQPWLMALIPIGLAIMPINKLTILLLLVLAADVAVALLLAEDLRRYRLHTVPGELCNYSHRLCCWTAGSAGRDEMAVNVTQIEALDYETSNAPLRGAHQPLLGATRCCDRIERCSGAATRRSTCNRTVTATKTRSR